MKRLIGFAAAAAVFCVVGTARAESWYAGGQLGLNITHDGSSGAGQITYEWGYGAGGFVGFRVDNNVRVEGEITYRANDLDTIGGGAVLGDMTSTAFMVNGFYDFDVQGSFRPYAGGGIGFADVTLTAGGNKFSETAVAMQVGAGVMFNVSGLDLSVDYRLFGTEDLGLGAGMGLGGVEYINSSVMVGLRKYF